MESTISRAHTVCIVVKFNNSDILFYYISRYPYKMAALVVTYFQNVPIIMKKHHITSAHFLLTGVNVIFFPHYISAQSSQHMLYSS